MQKSLLTEIRSQFDPQEIVADLCILYEVTGYKDDSSQEDFWDQYMDFFELGDETITAMNVEDLSKLIDSYIEDKDDDPSSQSALLRNK